MLLPLAVLYGGTLVAVAGSSAWRERRITADNLIMCLGLLALISASLLKADIIHLDRRGVLAGGSILNAAFVVGSRFYPIALFRASNRDRSAFRALDESGVSDEELAAFRGESNTMPVILIFVAGLAVCVTLAPDWFGI